jgi:hypothetical protein
MMTNLTWTKTKPTLPGHYWFRIFLPEQNVYLQKPHVREVVILDDALFITDPKTISVAELDGKFEFAGPIASPEETLIQSVELKSTLHGMTVDESLVISKRVVELVKKECKQMGIQYSNRPLLIAAYAAGGGSLSQHDLMSCDLVFDMGKNSIK